MAMRSGFLDRRPVLVGLVFLGGCLGTLMRAGISHVWPAPKDGVPWSTMAINLVGAFVLATLLEIFVHAGPDEGIRRAVRLCVGTGVLGGFTTYSTLAVETGQRIMSGQWLLGILYLLTSVVVGALLAWSMIAAVRMAVRRRSS
ncbi:CrcB family protein [Cutibacterium sp. WCA-380-WT-3A]|uniref:Fluoride-specific ion channel FluC n=1 Tax=Cutibacterium porci TaxID=2605781 RepID=A0A7K0J780_9ACTN|nr:CrcB family protein [Cutibacterium porci]MSS45815.1 CrcB family protein [Cutibacterium porci]